MHDGNSRVYTKRRYYDEREEEEKGVITTITQQAL